MTIHIDANIVIRLLVRDDPAKADRCEELFMNAASGEVKLRVTDVCLAEIAWTLRSFYKLEREDVAEKMLAILNTPGIEFSNVSMLIDACKRYLEKNVDFIDAYHAAVVSHSNSKIYSYDEDFKKFPDVERIEP